MKIAYGPPAQSGVKSLQYVGADDDADYVSTGLHQLAKPAGTIALGVWAFAWVTGRKTLKRTAFAVALGSFVVSVLMRPK